MTMNALGGAIFDTRTHNRKDPQRIKKCDKDYIKKFDYTNVTFPMAQKGYRKIGTMNNININVFGYEKQEPYPVYISKEKFNDMLNLIIIPLAEILECHWLVTA